MTAQQEIATMVFDVFGVTPSTPQEIVMEDGVVVQVRRARRAYGRSPLADAIHDAVHAAADFEASFRSVRDTLGQQVAEDIERQWDMITPNCRCVTVPVDSRDRQRQEMERTTRTMPTGGHPAIRKLTGK